jgi:hypothetical protein
MPQDTMTTEAKRDLIAMLGDDLYSRGYMKDVTFLGAFGWMGIKRQLPSLAPVSLGDVLRQLNAIEDVAVKDERRDQAEQAEAEARERARASVKADAAEALNVERTEETMRLAARAATVEGKLDRLIALNERIAAALERRGTGV